MMYWILCLALFAGAASATQQYVPKEMQPRDITVLQQFPSIVQIEFYLFWSSMEWVQDCAGSVINMRTVMTGASCTSGWSYEPRFRRIRAGSTFRNSGGLIFYVQDRINNPGWGSAYNGDVSLARTMTPLVYSPVIQQAAIAAPGSWIPNNIWLNQPGWGRAQQSTISNQQVVTASIASCGRRDGNFSSALNATADILCALTPNITSNYDVGGPWIFNGITLGIVSGVNTFGTYQNLIATDVSKYTNWIVNIANNWW